MGRPNIDYDQPRRVQSTGHEMLVRFRTDGSIIARGWNLTYHAGLTSSRLPGQICLPSVEEADVPESAPTGGGEPVTAAVGTAAPVVVTQIQYVTPAWYNADPAAAAKEQADLTRAALDKLTRLASLDTAWTRGGWRTGS